MKRALAKAASILLLLAGASAAQASGAPQCREVEDSFAVALSQMNINNMYPITLAGSTIATSGGARNCPSMMNISTCTCPGRLYGTPTPGVMYTMYMPQYVSEVVGTPGCSPILGGEQILGDSYAYQQSPADFFGGAGDDNASVRQVHWMNYPVFAVIGMIMDAICLHSSNVLDMAYMTEVDPIWQDELWAALFSPEGSLFASVEAMLASIPDSIAASFVKCNIDPFVWTGGAGHIYPWSGVTNTSPDELTTAARAVQEFTARHARVGMLWTTVTPLATCGPTMNPLLPKSQYRTDLLWPNGKTSGSPDVFGTNAEMYTSRGTLPFNEFALFLLWEGMQCCLHI